MLILEIKDQALLMMAADRRGSKFILNRTKIIDLGDNWKNYLATEKNRSTLIETLNGFKAPKNRIHLCLNHSSLIYRDIEVPKADPKTMAQLIRNELTNALNLSQDYLIDYKVIGETERGSNRFVRVLAAALQATVVNEYLEFFNTAGFRVQSVDVGLNAVTKYLEVTGLLQAETSVLIADVGTLNLRQFLFENGAYSFYRNTRLQEPVGNATSLIPLYTENISKMHSFALTQGKTRRVDAVLLFGRGPAIVKVRQELATADIQASLIAKPDRLDCTVQPFDPALVYALGVLFTLKRKGPKDINLLQEYQTFYKIKPFMFNLDKLTKPILITVFTLLAVWAGILLGLVYQHNQAIGELQAYLDQPEVVTRMAEIDALKSRTAKIGEMSAELDSIETVLLSNPVFDDAVIARLLSVKPETIELTRIEFKLASVEIGLSSPDPLLIQPYVSALNTLEGFANATYGSYTVDKASGLTRVTVTLTLKGAQ